MSQSAFAKAPANPYAASAAAFDAMLNQPQPEPQPQPQPEPQPDPQPDPQPVPQPDPQPQPQLDPQPVPQPDYGQQYYQQPYDNNAAIIQQLQAERDAAAQEIQQLRQAVSNLSETKRAQTRDEFLNNVFTDEFNNSLTTIDGEDARRIGGAVYDALAGQMDQMRGQMQQSAQYQQQANMQQQVLRLNSEVERVHPDFMRILGSRDFQMFLAGRDGYSSETRDQRAMREYQNGNSAYVIDLLNQYKKTKAAPQAQRTVPPSSAPASTTAPVATPQPSQYTLKELNDLFMMRRIDHDTYRKELQKLRAAQPNK